MIKNLGKPRRLASICIPLASICMLLHYSALTCFIKLFYLFEETEREPGSQDKDKESNSFSVKANAREEMGLMQICSNMIMFGLVTKGKNMTLQLPNPPLPPPSPSCL